MSLTYADPGVRGQEGLFGPLIDVRSAALVIMLGLLGSVGVIMLYSVENLTWTQLPIRHAIRLAFGLLTLISFALTPVRIWMALAYPAYVLALALLLGVEFFGETSKGATRWIALGPLVIQPSEIMKLAIVMALAKYYHQITEDMAKHPIGHMIPLMIIAAPVLLIAKQPDLGTAMLVTATGGALVFLSGVRWTHMLYATLPGTIGLVALFIYGLEPYQRERLLTYFDPEADKMGAGYNITQSIIAIGSGGLDGKGLGKGTQTQLDFIPEKETDFIVPVIAEEFGFLGVAALLAAAFAVAALAVSMAATCRHHFGRMLTMGVVVTFTLYIIINVAMVTGLAPVVGVPFPLVSNGGTVMLVVLASFGLVLSAHRQRYADLPKKPQLF